MNKIDEIKQVLVKATPGPWEVVDLSEVHIAKGYRHEGGKHIAHWISDMCQEDEQDVEQVFSDAHLIANAPEWLHYLIGEVERLRLNAVTEYAPHDIEQMEELIEIQQQEIERLRKYEEAYQRGVERFSSPDHPAPKSQHSPG